jgi:hypothetical protein
MTMFMNDLELITTEMVEKSLPDFDRPRIPYDVILILGGRAECTNYIETYDARTE